MNALIQAGVILMLCCFLFALLGLVAEAIQAIRRWRSEDNWTRNRNNWKRWSEL